MSPIKRSLVVFSIAFAVVSVNTFALTLPWRSTCLLVAGAELRANADALLNGKGSAVDQQRHDQLVRDARARIEATFGAVESKPILVFFSDPSGYGTFKLNAYGSTQFIGSHACVMIGPKGQNVDVVAHELMHAEIYHRVGYLKRLLQLPTWFDEGVAMQVDHRPRYALSAQNEPHPDYVRGLTTFSSFFSGDEQAVVRNYAAAQQVVASWLSRVGRDSLYTRLQRMKNGESFREIFAE
jgi:hypothetical protein